MATASNKGVGRTPDDFTHRASHGFLQDSLQVSLIATPREDFVVCRPNHTMGEARAIAAKDDYDYLPMVIPYPEVLKGVVPMKTHVRDDLNVCTFMLPLEEQFLIGADASIVEFARRAHETEFRFVVTKDRVGGLVTISDLQKLPVRASLFALITSLELAMTSAITSAFGSALADWPEKALSDDERSRVVKEVVRTQKAGRHVNDLVLTGFPVKVKLTRAALISRGMQSEADDFANVAPRIVILRNHLAHANFLAHTQKAAVQTSKSTDSAARWLDFLTSTFP